MKLYYLLLVACLSTVQLSADGIDFFHGTWEEAIAKAQTEQKIIFIDAYAEWCGPCKRMAATVFKDKAVGEFYNANFINMKLDMEKGEGLSFRRKYPVSAFPTLFFIDEKGQVVQKVKGAQQTETFIALGKKVLTMVDRSGDYAEAYENGDRSPDLVFKYIDALNKAGKPSIKIANEYLSQQKNLNTPDNLRILKTALTMADSRIFDLFINNRSALEKQFSKDIVADKIEMACTATIQRAIEFESEDLFEEAIDKMKKHYPAKAKLFAAQAGMSFCKAMGDAGQYTKACQKYVKATDSSDAASLYELAKDIEENFSRDATAMKQAEKWAKVAANKGGLYQYYYTYASILAKNGKTSEAKSIAQKSLEMAQQVEPYAVPTIQQLIERL